MLFPIVGAPHSRPSEAGGLARSSSTTSTGRRLINTAASTGSAAINTLRNLSSRRSAEDRRSADEKSAPRYVPRRGGASAASPAAALPADDGLARTASSFSTRGGPPLQVNTADV